MRDALPPFDPSLIPKKIDLSLTEDARQQVATYLLDRALQESSPLA
jgi:hypothetical protein